jgi:hypothetical protein
MHKRVPSSIFGGQRSMAWALPIASRGDCVVVYYRVEPLGQIVGRHQVIVQNAAMGIPRAIWPRYSAR